MASDQTLFVLSLGSNEGNRIDTLQKALDCLADTPLLEGVGVSRVYETVPVGGPPQRDFLNAVVLVSYPLSPHVLLSRTQAIEDALGRVRKQRWGPRTLDIDIISAGSLRHDEAELTIRHPRAGERPFVLVPWARLCPDAVLVDAGPVHELLTTLDTRGVRPRPDLRLRVD